LYVDTNSSEEHTVSIIRAEDGGTMVLQNVGIYLQGLINQKTNISIFTALRTSLTVVCIVLDDFLTLQCFTETFKVEADMKNNSIIEEQFTDSVFNFITIDCGPLL
jgi:hypothetical protein